MALPAIMHYTKDMSCLLLNMNCKFPYSASLQIITFSGECQTALCRFCDTRRVIKMNQKNMALIIQTITPRITPKRVNIASKEPLTNIPSPFLTFPLATTAF